MSTKGNDIRLIGGHSPCFVVTIKRNGKEVSPQIDYGGALIFARHGKTINASPESGYNSRFYYNYAIRKIIAVIPKKQSLAMVGNYNCHMLLVTSEGQDFRPEYAQTNVITGTEAK